MEERKNNVGDDGLKEYRQHLVLAGQKSQDDYDKTIIALSGGALAISFAFVKDYLGHGPIENVCFLLLSWISWGFSVTMVLASFYSSHLALRETIKQVDEGKIDDEKPGGAYSTVTAVLNLIGGILFLLGVMFMIFFVSANFSNRRVADGKDAQTSGATRYQSTDSKAYVPAESAR